MCSVHLRVVESVSHWTSISVLMSEFTQETGPTSVLLTRVARNLLSQPTSSRTSLHMPNRSMYHFQLVVAVAAAAADSKVDIDHIVFLCHSWLIPVMIWL